MHQKRSRSSRFHPCDIKEGDPYLRTLLVPGAQHILGRFGIDCDLRRWGLKLAERGGRNAKKRDIVATSRKLAVLLHHLWVSGEVYEPLHNSSRTAVAVAAQKTKTKSFQEEKDRSPKPSSGDCVNRPRTPNMHRANESLLESEDGSMATVATRQRNKPRSNEGRKNSLDSDRPSHGRRLHQRRN